jgi:hypothetical protein
MTSRPSTEQLLVQVLMRAAQEVLRTLEQEAEEAPERSQAKHELELAFAPIWSRIPYLDLTCLDDKLGWREQIVLAPEEDEYGLTRTLVMSGIHGLTLVPGCEKDEMVRFLTLVDKKRRLDEDGDQDLVLMLFRADLHHIRYTVGAVPGRSTAERDVVPTATHAKPAFADLELDLAPGLPVAETTGPAAEPEAMSDIEDPSDDMGADAPSAADDALTLVAPEDLRAAVRADAEESDEGRGVVRLEKFDSTLYFLDQREIEYLRGAIDRHSSEDHARNVLDLLLDILQLRPEPDVRDEVIGILAKLLPYLLSTGRFQSVAYLTSELRKVTRETTLDPRHKKALDELRVSISATEALTQLFHVLDDGTVSPTPESLGTLLREMRHEAIQSVLVWIGQLNRPAAKAALVTALEQFFTQWPAALGKVLSSKDRTVVHRALAIANKLQLPDFVDPLAEVLSSEDAAVRRLAVTTLAGIGTVPALKAVAGAVDDPDAEVRTTTYAALTARPYRGAQKGLRTTIESADLEELDLSERRALFTAFGAVAGAGGVSTFEPILMGKGRLKRRPSSGTRACAALGLGVINSPTARFALEKAAEDKDPLVRSAASAALRAEASAS